MPGVGHGPAAGRANFGRHADRAEPGASAPKIDWAGAPDCQAKLGLLAEAARSGQWDSNEPAPIAVALPGRADQRDWLAPPSVTVIADLPLELHERVDPALHQVPCVLMVEPPQDQHAAQRLIGRETVRSVYESGVRSEHNPDYDAAQLRVRQAERVSKEETPDIVSVGDPMLDLFGALVGGVIAGFSQGSGERELDNAMTVLAETPRSLNRPVYRPYQFERETVLAGREATVSIALADRANRRLWQAQLHRRERRQFEILEGLDPRDRDFEQHSTASVTRDDFERWQREPPQLQLSAIVAALREAPPAPPTESVIAAIERLDGRSLAAEPPAIDPAGAPPEPVPSRSQPSREPADLDRRTAPPAGPSDLVAAADPHGEAVAKAVKASARSRRDAHAGRRSARSERAAGHQRRP